MRRAGVWCLALALVLSALACASDGDGGGNGPPPEGFVNNQEPEGPGPEAPGPDDPGPEGGEPEGGEPEGGEPEGGEPEGGEPEPEAEVCSPRLYAEAEGVFVGNITTVTRGPNFPEQQTTSEVTIDLDPDGFEVVDNPNCTFDYDACFMEVGARLTTVCNTNGILTQSITTTTASTDEPDRYSQSTRSESTTSQDGRVTNTSSVEATFTLTLIDPDTLDYLQTTRTTIDAGIFTSETTGRLRRQR